MPSMSMRFPEPDLDEGTARKLDAAAKQFLDKHLEGEHEQARALVIKARRRYGDGPAIYRIIYTLVEHITLTCPDDKRTADGTPRLLKILPPARHHELRATLQIQDAGPGLSSAALLGIPDASFPVPAGLDPIAGVQAVEGRISAWAQRLVEAVNDYREEDFAKVLGEVIHHPEAEGERSIQALLALLALVCAFTNPDIRPLT